MRLLGAHRRERIDADRPARRTRRCRPAPRRRRGRPRPRTWRVGGADAGQQRLQRLAHRERRRRARPPRRRRPAPRYGRAPARAPWPAWRQTPSARRSPACAPRRRTTAGRGCRDRRAGAPCPRSAERRQLRRARRSRPRRCRQHAHVRDRLLGIRAATTARAPPPPAAPARRRAHDQVLRRVEGEPAVGHLRRRQVHLRLALALEAAHADVADDADHRRVRDSAIENCRPSGSWPGQCRRRTTG